MEIQKNNQDAKQNLYNEQQIYGRIFKIIPENIHEKLRDRILSSPSDKKYETLATFLKTENLMNPATDSALKQIKFELDIMNFDNKITNLSEKQFEVLVSNS